MSDTSRVRSGAPTLIVAVVFGFFYAYEEWEGIGNLIQVPAVYAGYRSAGIDVGAVPWGLLVAGVLIPVVVYGLAFFLARRRGMLDRIILLFVGLAVVAALSLAIFDLPPLL
jgi:hypothetical protein